MVFHFVIYPLLMPIYFCFANLASSLKDKSGCSCGVESKQYEPEETSIHYRIMSNMTVKPPYKYPWVVQLRLENTDVCGGTIINPVYVLTAGHCAILAQNQLSRDTMKPVVGVATKHREKEYLPVRIIKVIMHPKYKKGRNISYNDIALLKLEEVLYYSERLTPVCLPRGTEYDKNQQAYALGWGQIEDGGLGSFFLKQAIFPIISKEDCTRRIPDGEKKIFDYDICAGGLKKQDVCEGDSGGPLQVRSDKDGKWYLVGIVSWGLTCGDQAPAVFTKVSYYLDWIREETKNAVECSHLEKTKLGSNLDDCGMPSLRSTDVNNVYLRVLKWPWTAEIRYDKKFLGTGVLVNRTVVLTTTDVIDPWGSPLEPQKLTVMLGRERKDKNKSLYNVFGVQAVIFHPFAEFESGLVLLRLRVSMVYDTLHYHPICLTNSLLKTAEQFDTTVITEKASKISKKPKRNKIRTVIKKATAKSVNDTECKDKSKVDKKTLCVKLDNTDFRNCSDEKGIILQHKYNESMYLVGISSDKPSKSCQTPRRFVILKWYETWIRQAVHLGNKMLP